MKHKVLTVCIAIFAFFLALGIMLYPPLSNAYNEKHKTEILTYYQEEVKEKDDSLLIAAKENAVVYNRSLVPGVQLEKAFSNEALQQASEDYDNLLNITGNGIMGYSATRS